MERGSVSLAGGTGRRIVGGARSIASWDGEVGEKPPNEKKRTRDGLGSGMQFLISYPGYQIDLLYI